MTLIIGVFIVAFNMYIFAAVAMFENQNFNDDELDAFAKSEIIWGISFSFGCALIASYFVF